MNLTATFACLLAICTHVFAAEKQPASPLGAVTEHVFTLRTAARSHHLTAPSSKHLARRRNGVIPRQSSIGDEPIASIHQELTTIGGRVYMTNVSIAGRSYTLVIDTGSSDTWVASSKFRCLSPDSSMTVPQSYCGFSSLFNEDKSSTYELIPSHNFSVRYTDGEFLTGNLARENIAFGEDNQVRIRQTIGVVEEGYWMGDGISSGLLGMAYPALVSGAKDLNYSSVVFTLFQNTGIPPMFSLALTSPTSEDPSIGGVLAIGGIPNVTHDWDFVAVPIHPVVSSSFTFYSIPVDGFSVTPPSRGRVKGKLLPIPLSPPRKRLDFTKNSLDMIIDSGSTLLYFPDAVCDYVASLFDPPAVFNASTNLYIVPCDAAAPKVGIILDGKTFNMRESDLMNKAPGAVGGASLGIKEGDCVCAFQRQGGDDAVLGDSWLRSVLVLIDLEAAEVRVAARV